MSVRVEERHNLIGGPVHQVYCNGYLLGNAGSKAAALDDAAMNLRRMTQAIEAEKQRLKERTN